MAMRKRYFIPKTEVMFMQTADVMHTSQPSDTPSVPGAPSRKVPVLGNDSVKAF